MFEITKKEKISDDQYIYTVRAPKIAKKAKAGQFIVIRVKEGSERIPLTIADYDGKEFIKFAVLSIGKSTKELGILNEGDKIRDILGPLGHSTEIFEEGKVVIIGGGVGIAAILPMAKEFRKAADSGKKIEIVTIIGAKNKDLLIFDKELEGYSDRFYIATNDGSAGTKGFVTDKLNELMNTEKIDRIIAVGPVVMMEAVSKATRPFEIKTIVSLNPIMVDGIGMCGACRVNVDGNIKFACVDGPEFDAHKVDFNELKIRQMAYRDAEKDMIDKMKVDNTHSHNCEGNR